MRKTLIRVDISPKIGGGHLSRMIGLAQLLFDHGYEVHFASVSHDGLIESLLSDEFLLHNLKYSAKFASGADLKELIVLAEKVQPEWIILDGYHLPTSDEVRLRSKGFRVVRIDDLPVQRCEADLLLNHNHGSELFNHEISNHTVIFTGLKYLLLRREFRNADIGQKRFSPVGELHLIVSLGGGSPLTDAVCYKIVQALSEVSGIFGSASIILGKMGVISDDLLSVSRNADFPITFALYKANMAEEMLKADIAITSGGYSMWELLYLKTPFLVVSLNQAQDEYIRFLADEGLCDVIGSHEEVTADLIKTAVMSFVHNESHRRQIISKSESLLDRQNNGKRLLKFLAN